jgi:hypothetical protein
MQERYLFRGKPADTGEWVEGYNRPGSSDLRKKSEIKN